MKKIIVLLPIVGLLLANQAFGSGYRIPEQSMASTALSGAYIANAFGADASYSNPANMGWTGEGWQTDANLTYINLPSVKYSDTVASPTQGTGSGESEPENFFLPQLHMISPDLNNFRIGLSLHYPAGLSHRWKDGYPRTFAENFTLKVTELSPSVSYAFSDKYAVAAGVRLLRAEGKVVSNGTVKRLPDASEIVMIRDLEGDTIEYGYNLAITARASKDLTFSLTYRSNVDLDIEGDATLTGALMSDQNVLLTPLGSYSGGAEVSVPVPAVSTLATAYTFDKTTIEFVWDRTYWSEYKTLDFNYDKDLYVEDLPDAEQPNPLYAFDKPSDKSWVDTDAFRLGVTHQLNDALTLMGAIAIDENPVPDNRVSFELPDSDARLFSLGASYVINKKLTVGVSYLYDYKVSRTVRAYRTVKVRLPDDSIVDVESLYIDGKFKDAAAHMLSLGAQYTF